MLFAVFVMECLGTDFTLELEFVHDAQDVLIEVFSEISLDSFVFAYGTLILF